MSYHPLIHSPHNDYGCAEAGIQNSTQASWMGDRDPTTGATPAASRMLRAGRWSQGLVLSLGTLTWDMGILPTWPIACPSGYLIFFFKKFL